MRNVRTRGAFATGLEPWYTAGSYTESELAMAIRDGKTNQSAVCRLAMQMLGVVQAKCRSVESSYPRTLVRGEVNNARTCANL